MRIILLKDVRNVGRKDEIKDVADGYANNFLLRQNLAVPASLDRIKALEQKHAEIEAARAQEDAAIDEGIQALANDRIEIVARATPKGGLFKSIGAGEIVRAIQERRNIHLPESALHLEAPVKTAGEHIFLLRSKKASAQITLVVSPVE